jgi:DNA-binding NtrC family response regulator
MAEAATIFIAEDDADVRKAAQLALLYSFERVATAASAVELVAMVGSTPCDAVLLDMNFVHGARNGSEGLGALTRIQSLDSSLAVVLMTAYGGVALAVEALKRGAVDFVLKPWGNEKLVRTMSDAVGITRQRRLNEKQALATLEKSAIERALQRHAGNISSAAADLGISRPALYRRIAKFGL